MTAKSKTPLPSRELLQQVLDYDPDTGALTWKVRPLSLCESEHSCASWNTRFAGKPAMNSVNNKGYMVGTVLGVRASAHRVIWKMMTGDEPDMIDHDDGHRSNNRWLNLKDSSRSENNRNAAKRSDNTSGVTGVSWFAHKSRWAAQISINGKNKLLGLFDDKAQAIQARKNAEVNYGFHKNHGRN